MNQYIGNKLKYINIKNHDQSGGKRSGKKLVSITPYNITSKYSEKYKTIRLPGIDNIKKIGELKIATKAIIGDTDWSEIDLKPGIYDAYQVDDNLMLINQSLNITPDKSIIGWDWIHSGTGVGADSGTFGFYDLAVIDKIADKIKAFASNHYIKSLPYFNVSSMGEVINGTIISGSNLEPNIKHKDKYGAFGVIKSTGGKDLCRGGFECYMINDDRAILIGKLTASKLCE